MPAARSMGSQVRALRAEDDGASLWGEGGQPVAGEYSGTPAGIEELSIAGAPEYFAQYSGEFSVQWGGLAAAAGPGAAQGQDAGATPGDPTDDWTFSQTIDFSLLGFADSQLIVDSGQGNASGGPISADLNDASTPAASTTFDAITVTSSGYIPPDPIGAAGPGQVVNVVNVNLQWFTKTGTLQNSQTLKSFFGSPTDTFDPKVIYDAQADRFVMVSLERQSVSSGAPSNESRVYVAISDDSDPNGTWYKYNFSSKINIGGADYWADYPGLAVDDQAIYITANMFPFAGGSGDGGRLWVIPKSGAYSGGAFSPALYDPSTASGVTSQIGGKLFTLQPAHVIDGDVPGATGTFLVSYSGLQYVSGALAGQEAISVIAVSNPLTSPTFTNTFVTVGDITSTHSVPDAPQLGTSTLIDTGDERIYDAVWRNGNLYATTTINVGGQATAHWFKLNTGNPSNVTLSDQGNILGEDIATGAYTYYPSVAVNSQDTMAIGFAASAPTKYGGAYFTMKTTADAAGTVENSSVLREGQGTYALFDSIGRNRWGDYSGISVDPADDRSFWVFNEYALTANRWGTAWGKLEQGVPADLVVSSITPTSSNVAQGAAFGYSFTVANQGAGGTGGTFWTTAFLDQQVTPINGAWNNIGPIAAGGSQSASNSFGTAGIGTGQHTLWIKADAFNTVAGQFHGGNNDVAESDENNNWTSTTFTVTAPSLADLAVSNVTLGSSSVTQGASLGYSFTVTNEGAGGTGGTFWTTAFLDQQVTPINGAWNNIGPIAGSGSQSGSNSFTTTGLSVGQHTLWIKADAFNSSTGQFNSGNNDVAESDETDNWRSVTFDVTAPAPAPQPDLAVSSITPTASSVTQGADFSFSYTVANQGATSTGGSFWSTAFLDQQVTPINGAWNMFSAIAGNGSQSASNSFSTAGISTGQHTLWIKADAFNSSSGQFNSGNNDVTESDETDNWTSTTFTITAPAPPPSPDLAVASITAPASVAQGGMLNYSYTVANEGAGGTGGPFWSAAYLDQQSTPVNGAWNQFSPIAGGGSQSASNSLSTAGLSVGQHTLWIKADPFNSAAGQFNVGNNDVAESDETDNWRSVTFNVTTAVQSPQPDLVVSSITPTASSVSQGAAFGYSFVVGNQGTAGTGSMFWAAAYLDQQSTAFNGAWNQFSPIAASGSQSASNSFSTAGLSVGQHTLWIKADSFNSAAAQFNVGNNDVAESDENNNWTSITFDVTAPPPSPQPDLVVSSISPDATDVTLGTSLTYSYLVGNQGNAATGSMFWSAAYIDQQSTAFTGAWNHFNALAAGGSQSAVNLVNTASLGVGQHTLWIKADSFNSAAGQFNVGNNDVAESNENNNWTSRTFNVLAASSFDVAVAFTGDATYLPYFQSAAARWGQIITADLPGVTHGTYGSIDDLLITASATAIDGVGGTLGQAGPDLFRSGSLLPYHGVMQFDSADMQWMAAEGILTDVILHEMGHVLGIGTLWASLSLKSGFQYTGAHALDQYRVLTGNPAASSVPLETTGGSGTAGVHWSDAAFGNELMTGYIDDAPNPLSKVTVGSLHDMGYAVNYFAADSYFLPAASAGPAGSDGSSGAGAVRGSAHGHGAESGADMDNASLAIVGDDIVVGSADGDVLAGWGGDDTLFGDGGDDELFGGAGDDVLDGGAGDDRLFGDVGFEGDGEAGNDVFVMRPGGGVDTIAGFAAGAGLGDRIDLADFGFADFAAVMDATSDAAGGAAIQLGAGDRLILQDVAKASLDPDDFILA